MNTERTFAPTAAAEGGLPGARTATPPEQTKEGMSEKGLTLVR